MTRNIIIHTIGVAVLAVSAMAQKSATSGGTQQPQYVVGPRGGCYEVTQGGKKKSVARSFCAPASQSAPAQPSAASKSQSNTSSRTTAPTGNTGGGATGATTIAKGNRTYVKGAKGGCYYLTPSGRKQYVDRSMCQ